MAMQSANVTIKGVGTLLQNNPQTVDRFNKFSRRAAAINAKKTRRTDDDYLELREIEVESKTHFDEAIGVYAPASWLMESMACNGFKVAKLSRDTIRGSVFVTDDKLKLQYEGMERVKTIRDIVMNQQFHWVAGLPQGQVRVMKAFPKFQKWSFQATIEFDDKMVDPGSLTAILQHAAKYNGFGDFRPTFGRAIAEVNHV